MYFNLIPIKKRAGPWKPPLFGQRSDQSAGPVPNRLPQKLLYSCVMACNYKSVSINK